eukprot:6456739-Amphidinium_carterae.1
MRTVKASVCTFTLSKRSPSYVGKSGCLRWRCRCTAWSREGKPEASSDFAVATCSLLLPAACASTHQHEGHGAEAHGAARRLTTLSKS